VALLEIDSLSCFYGDFQALFGVSLHVDEGETIAVIGANGAGKSTLLAAVAGMVQPAGGDVRFDGASIRGLPAYRRVSIGISLVPEGRRIFPSLTVRENLLVGARHGSGGRWTLQRVFELFPALVPLAGRWGNTLSGGEQQMCAIGRALMSRPRLLLMDEPSAGLAPLVVQELFELIRRIRAEGLTVLIVEQNIQHVLEVVDRAYLLEVGAIRLAGTSTELKNNEFIRKAYMGL
jgi:branched-chain amino acid transport system ATP-binding protein